MSGQKKRRTLTKKQKFDLEMIYKPILLSKNVPYIRLGNDSRTISTPIKLLDFITDYFRLVFDRSSNLKEIFTFLDEYKDVMNWNKFAYNISFTFLTKSELKKFLERYNEYLTSACWQSLAMNSKFRDCDDLLIKYADKINWQLLSKYKHFTTKSIVELKNYIDFNFAFNKRSIDSVIYKQMVEFTKDHLEEVMSYKKEKECE